MWNFLECFDDDDDHGNSTDDESCAGDIDYYDSYKEMKKKQMFNMNKDPLLSNFPSENNRAEYKACEKTAFNYFQNQDISAPKKSFNYLFLDPRVTKILHGKSNKLKNNDLVWKTFIKSIFYIGKGTGTRPYTHLSEAKCYWENYQKGDTNKFEHILEIWKSGKGIVCLQVFHNITSDEAHTYEAAMIDAIGKDYLTNVNYGSYKGNVASWKEIKQRKLGIYLLYKALRYYVLERERERELRLEDV